jgi:hypothetical protein
MRSEFKYLFYVLTILGFFIFVIFYYFSDNNKKKSYRSIKLFESEITKYSNNLITLKNDTDNIIEYVDDSINKDSKKYKFWELLF